MKKRMQLFFVLLLSVSLLFPSSRVFSQFGDDGFAAGMIATYFEWGIGLADALDGKDDIDTLRSIRDSYQRSFDNMVTQWENRQVYDAADIVKVLRGGFMKYLNKRVELAEEMEGQANSSMPPVVSTVLRDGADAVVNENIPAEPNPVIAKILPVLQRQTKQNATDLLYGRIASQIPESGAVISSSSPSQIYNVDAGLPPSSAPPVISQDGNGNDSDGAINIQKPLQFANNGLYDATVRAFSYTPAEGGTAGMSSASTVVFRDSNPSAYLELPIGTYVFCYYWDWGTDTNNDGYVDYAHKNTGNVTLTAQSTDNMNSAQVVTLNPGSMNNPNGKCGETAPPPSGNAGGLTPQELANQGTHTYRIDCPTEELLNSEAWVTSYNFVAGGANIEDENGSWFYNKINVNTYFYDYSEIDIPITYTFIFTNAGFNLLITGAEDSATCTGIRR